MQVARETGARWDVIAGATGATAEQAEAEYTDAIDRKMRYGVIGLAT